MRLPALLLAFVTSVASAQFTNHKLADVDVANAGASIAVSPRNNKAIVASAGGKIFYSIDAGATWKPSSVDLTKGVAGSVNVSADSKGNFFLVYSADPDSKGKSEDAWMGQIICRHSTDDGKTFSEPVIVATTPGKDVFGPVVSTSTKKEGMIIIWNQSDSYGSDSGDCKSSIWTSQSGNGGKKWSTPFQLNEKDGGCSGPSVAGRIAPAVGHDGKTFATWSTGEETYYDRSYDGEQWLSSDQGFARQVGGLFPEISGFGEINNAGMIAIDNSPSRIHGTIFYAYSDLKSGVNDSDIWLMRTVTRGDTWTVPARINQDEPGKHQFMPRICVDPANGFIYMLYYDRRNYADNQTDVYIAWSLDGGNQFKEKKINEAAFAADLAGDHSLTDFIGLSVQKGLIVPVWTSISNGKLEVWTAPIKHEDLVK